MGETSAGELESRGRLVSTMLRSIYSFSEMRFEADPAAPDRYHLDWRGIEILDASVLEVTLGFVTALVKRSLGPLARVTLARLTPDHARYTVNRG